MKATEVQELYRRLRNDHPGSHPDCDACAAMGVLATVLARHWDPRTGTPHYLIDGDDLGPVCHHPRETEQPLVHPRMDADATERKMHAALLYLARHGCTRLTPPSGCRQSNGYPREEWCEGCVAADALNMPVDWFVLR